MIESLYICGVYLLQTYVFPRLVPRSCFSLLLEQDNDEVRQEMRAVFKQKYKGIQNSIIWRQRDWKNQILKAK